MGIIRVLLRIDDDLATEHLHFLIFLIFFLND